MSDDRLREKLLPRKTQTNGAQFPSSRIGQNDSFLRFPIPRVNCPAPAACTEPTSGHQDRECLRRLMEHTRGANYTEGNGKSRPSISRDDMDGMLEAITTTSGSDPNNSSGIFGSSSEMLSSWSLSAGNASDTSGSFVTPAVQNRFGRIHPTTGSGVGVMTGSFDDVTTKPHEIYDITSSISDVINYQHLGWESSLGNECDLAGINPFDTGTIDIDQYIYDLEVKFLDLENRVFEKQQSRKDKKARQRIIDGKVTFLIKSDRPVGDVRVWVRREPLAAKSFKDGNGKVPLKAVCEMREGNNWKYRVDLDSVYDGPDGPIYALARVNTQEKNMFELLVQVVFPSGEASDPIKSDPFLIRTLMKRPCDNNEPDTSITKGKRTRPHTCPSSSSRWFGGKRNRDSLGNEADSTDHWSPSSAESRTSPSSSKDSPQLDELVVHHLEAQRAHIENLTFGCMLQTPKGDIGYHLRLTNPDMYQGLGEGVVVGFYANDEGLAMIEPLSSENASQAVMAGVISRSAYLQARTPTDKEKGKTDIVCVIGMVKVQIVGSVHTGERIYASPDNPGTGIPESHLPLGAFIVKNHTSNLLGMAMETGKPRVHDEVNLVECFVCIVLGINSQQLSNEVENMLERTDMDIKAAISKSHKKTSRRMICIVAGLLTLLGLLGFLLYELLAPGTLLRYYLCRRGSIPGPHLRCSYDLVEEEVDLVGIQFSFDNLKKKIPPKIKKPKCPLDKGPSDKERYFLNYERCAYGGRGDGGMAPTGTTQPVHGQVFWASNVTNCEEVYYYLNSSWKLLYEYKLNCSCSGVGGIYLHWVLFVFQLISSLVLPYLHA